MTWTRALLAGAALLAVGPAAAGRRLIRPESEALLRAALTPPRFAYGAVLRVVVFPPSGKVKAQTRDELRAPGGRWRVEVRRGRKAAAPVLLWICDGSRQAILWPKARRAWTGPAAAPRSEERKLSAERARWELAVSTGGRVAKRPTWRLDFREKGGSTLRRAQWTDRETGLLLKREDYGEDGRLERRTRFLKLSVGLEVPAERFVPQVPPGYEVTASTGALAAAAALLEAPR